MGFLLSIITDVNNDKNLEKYNNNIDTMLEKIKQAQYNRQHFDSSIAAVSRGIREWVRGVEERNESITTLLKILLQRINGHLAANMEFKPITDQLRNWEAFAGDYLAMAVDSELALNDIDGDLKTKLLPKVELIKQVVESFDATINDEIVKTSAKNLNSSFSKQRTEVNEHIAEKFGDVQRILNEKIMAIGSSVESLTQEKRRKIENIKHAIRDAFDTCDELLLDYNTKYKSQIQNEFTALHEAMKDINPDDEDATLKGKCTLRLHVEKLQAQSYTMDKLLKSKLQDMKTKIDVAVDDALENRQHGLDALDGYLKTDLENIRNDMQRQIYAYIDKQVGAILQAAKLSYTVYGKNIADTGLLRNLADDSKLRDLFNSMSGSTAGNIIKALQAIYDELRLGGILPVPNIQDLDFIKYLKSDVANELKKVIKDASEGYKFSEIFMHKYYIQTMKEERREGELRGMITGIKEQFEDEFKSDGTIKSENVNGYEQAKQGYNTAIYDVLRSISNLETLPAAVEAAEKEAGKLMNLLENEIRAVQQAINKIGENVRDADTGLDAALLNVMSSLRDVESNANLAISALRVNIQKRAKEAFDELQDGVQTLFANQKKAELKALRETVATQIPIIQKIIDDDANAGLKGLMKKLDKRFQASTFKGLTHLTLKSLANRFNEFFRDYFNDVKNQPDLSDHSSLLTPLADALSALLSTMNTQRHFHADVSSRLADLQTQLDTLTATQFAEASPLLNVVKAGVRAFHGELAKQYVSRYSGNWFTDKVVKPKTSSEAKTVKTMPNPADNTEITEYGRKCAKVFLTALSITHNALKALKKYGSVRWRSQQVNDTTEFGKFFINHGYHVATGDKQQWELQDKVTKTGFHIYKLVVKDDDEHVYTKHDHDQDNGPLKRLHGCLQTYYRVGHVTSASAKKRPSNIFEILCWISGLPSN
ncbi:hypothetical protein, conserved, partial [Babesia bigemina]